MVGHVAAKDEPAIFVDDEKSVGPNPVGAMNSAIELIDKDWELNIFQPLQVARVSELLFE